jgi:MYXO-CTERM domain-containing protein
MREEDAAAGLDSGMPSEAAPGKEDLTVYGCNVPSSGGAPARGDYALATAGLVVLGLIAARSRTRKR